MRGILDRCMRSFRLAIALKLAPAAVVGGLIAAFSPAAPAFAGTVDVSGGEAHGQRGDGTMSPAARAAMLRGPLPASAAIVAAKAAADRAYDAAMRTAPPPSPTIPAAAGGSPSPRSPVIVSPLAGQFDANSTPPDTTGASGTTRFVQLVNSRFEIVDRATNAVLSAGTLNALAGWGSLVNSFDPQIIWDPTTDRFYYAMDSVVSATNNRIAFGFSKSSSPSTAADWCKYSIAYGSVFPDYPKLGDNQYFILIGVNDFDSLGSFLRSDLIAMPKPIGSGTISTCPTFTELKNSRAKIFQDLRNAASQQLFSPTPANSADTGVNGYVVAINLFIPSTSLWIVPANGPAAGLPTISAARSVTIPATSIPPGAAQPGVTQKLDTSDTRMTQANLGRNPLRSNTLSLWTQQTVANGTTGSKIQYYEIRPDVLSPILRRTGTIGTAGVFYFNAAISSDRRVDGATVANGDSFVIGYNVSSTSINPRIVMGSSVSSGILTFTTVRNSTGPYVDFACAAPGDTCRWGDYSGAAPDPRPIGSTRAVALTNQYASGGTSTAQSNWRTRIWWAQP